MQISMSSALQGMQANQNKMLKHASSLSRINSNSDSQQPASSNTLQDMVGVMESQRGFEANLAVLKASDEMMGTLIDTFA